MCRPFCFGKLPVLRLFPWFERRQLAFQLISVNSITIQIPGVSKTLHFLRTQRLDKGNLLFAQSAPVLAGIGRGYRFCGICPPGYASGVSAGQVGFEKILNGIGVSDTEKIANIADDGSRIPDQVFVPNKRDTCTRPQILDHSQKTPLVIAPNPRRTNNPSAQRRRLLPGQGHVPGISYQIHVSCLGESPFQESEVLMHVVFFDKEPFFSTDSSLGGENRPQQSRKGAMSGRFSDVGRRHLSRPHTELRVQQPRGIFNKGEPCLIVAEISIPKKIARHHSKKVGRRWCAYVRMGIEQTRHEIAAGAFRTHQKIESKVLNYFSQLFPAAAIINRIGVGATRSCLLGLSSSYPDEVLEMVIYTPTRSNELSENPKIYCDESKRINRQIHPVGRELFCVGFRGSKDSSPAGSYSSLRAIPVPVENHPPPRNSGECSIGFIERKEPDWKRVQEILNPSRAANHWANGGPVSRAFEARIAELIQIPENKAVVACSSATSAMSALVGAHSYTAGRHLRWVVSAFGFFNTTMGLLHNSIILDCDRRGLLNLTDLKSIDPDDYDGVIVTNPFGFFPDWRPYVSFCREQKKILIYDNAHALLGCDRKLAYAPEEIISFHHTKPWGMGEGGCAVVSKALEPTVRSIINFGVGLNDQARHFALNGKLSDLSSAFMLDRLATISEWSAQHRLQEKRIIQLGGALGMHSFGPAHESPRNSAVLVANHPVPRESLRGQRFPIERYYRPLAPDAANAAWLYNRILNVPCHRGLALLSDEEIVAALRNVVSPG